MSAKLRVISHIVGASCFVSSEKQLGQLEEFYDRMFNLNDHTSVVAGAKFVRMIEPSLLEQLDVHEKTGWFRRPSNHKALWVPHVAVTEHFRPFISKNDVLADVHNPNDGHPWRVIATLSSKHADPQGRCLMTLNPEYCGGELLPFVAVQVPEDRPVHQNSATSAPFPMQPKVNGVVNWFDALVMDPSNQRAVAKQLRAAFGWNMAQPLKMPMDGEYITLLNDTGLTENRHKIGGMLPKAMLLPSLAKQERGPHAMTVPFISCASKDDLMVRAGMAVKHGGQILVPIMSADGDITVIEDPCGGVVGLYHRTDDWDVIKPTTHLVPEEQYDTIDALSFTPPPPQEED